MSSLHAFIGFAVVALFAVGWLWGLVAWIAKKDVGAGFWVWLTTIQIVVGAQAIVGTVLLLMGRRPSDWLHLVYGYGPLLVLAIAHVIAREGQHGKPGVEPLKPWVPFAWAAFVCFGLTLRGLMTGLGVG